MTAVALSGIRGSATCFLLISTRTHLASEAPGRSFILVIQTQFQAWSNQMARIGVDVQLSVEETEALLAAIEEALGTKLTGQQILKLKEVLIRQRFQTEDFTPA
jgi:hypothetical protein